MKMYDNYIWWIIIILFIIVIIMILILAIYSSQSPPTTYYLKLDYNIGNVLEDYFGVVAWYFINKKDANISFYSGDKTPAFMKRLPSKIKYNPEIRDRLMMIPNANKLARSSPLRVDDWSRNRGLLRAMIPVIKEIIPYILDNTILTLESKLAKGSLRDPLAPNTILTPNSKSPLDSHDIVIHFRCADSPRNRHYEYFFQKYPWYLKSLKWAIDHLELLGINSNKVTILSCTSHVHPGFDFKKLDGSLTDKEKQNKLCNEVVRHFEDYLIKHGYNPTIMCGSIEEDFSIMCNAKCLISPGSSMSYVAALTNDNLMITPDFLHTGLVSESKYNNVSFRDNWYILPSEELDHSDVPDYDDIEHVKRLLLT